MLAIALSILGMISGASTQINALIMSYGYLAIFILMTLESASLPIPSEVVLPLAGLFAARGELNFFVALIVILAGSMLGIAIDYYVAYFIGKDFVYKHAKRFGIQQEHIIAFEKWFERNGSFAVFVSRLIPVVRGLMSFPAGFALMDKKKFFAYSFVGALVWDSVLMLFGYYALAANNAAVVLSAIGVFAVVVYAIFHLSMKHIRKIR